jgi:hypothetical protein
MKKNRYYTLHIISVVLLLSVTSVLAENQVIVDFYYSKTCGPCGEAVVVVNEVKAYYAKNYSGIVIIHTKEITSNLANNDEMEARGLTYPSVIINNKTKIFENNITKDYLIKVIDSYIANLSADEIPGDIVYLPFIGAVNLCWPFAIFGITLLLIAVISIYYRVKKK